MKTITRKTLSDFVNYQQSMRKEHGLMELDTSPIKLKFAKASLSSPLETIKSVEFLESVFHLTDFIQIGSISVGYMLNEYYGIQGGLLEIYKELDSLETLEQADYLLKNTVINVVSSNNGVGRSRKVYGILYDIVKILEKPHAYLVSTPKGSIEISPRKRVVQVDWSNTSLEKHDLGSVDIFSGNTSKPGMIHCWTVQQFYRVFEILTNSSSVEISSTELIPTYKIRACPTSNDIGSIAIGSNTSYEDAVKKANEVLKTTIECGRDSTKGIYSMYGDSQHILRAIVNDAIDGTYLIGTELYKFAAVITR